MDKLLTVTDILVEIYNKQLRERVQQKLKTKDIEYFKQHDPNHIHKLIIDTPTKSKQQIVWLTITKSDNCTVDEYIKTIHTLRTYKLLSEDSKYCFESTSYENNQYGNIHTHYLCKKQIGVNKQQYLTRLNKILKGIAFNINIQIYTKDYYNDKIDYLNGKKQKDQYDKPEITQNFRDENNLNHVY